MLIFNFIHSAGFSCDEIIVKFGMQNHMLVDIRHIVSYPCNITTKVIKLVLNRSKMSYIKTNKPKQINKYRIKKPIRM